MGPRIEAVSRLSSSICLAADCLLTMLRFRNIAFDDETTLIKIDRNHEMIQPLVYHRLLQFM